MSPLTFCDASLGLLSFHTCLSLIFGSDSWIEQAEERSSRQCAQSYLDIQLHLICKSKCFHCCSFSLWKWLQEDTDEADQGNPLCKDNNNLCKSEHGRISLLLLGEGVTHDQNITRAHPLSTQMIHQNQAEYKPDWIYNGNDQKIPARIGAVWSTLTYATPFSCPKFLLIPYRKRRVGTLRLVAEMILRGGLLTVSFRILHHWTIKQCEDSWRLLRQYVLLWNMNLIRSLFRDLWTILK